MYAPHAVKMCIDKMINHLHCMGDKSKEELLLSLTDMISVYGDTCADYATGRAEAEDRHAVFKAGWQTAMHGSKGISVDEAWDEFERTGLYPADHERNAT